MKNIHSGFFLTEEKIFSNQVKNELVSEGIQRGIWVWIKRDCKKILLINNKGKRNN